MTGMLYHLKVKGGQTDASKINVRSDAQVIGSSPEADVVIEGPGVAPRHAQIVFQGGQVLLEDLGSETGTFRNGARLLGPVQVFPGDRIGLGPEVVLILEGDGPEGEAEEDPSADLGLAGDPLAPAG